MTLASFSNYGPDLDIVAPGHQVGVFSAVHQQPISRSGTSYAAPMVAGVAALLKAFDPSLTAAELKELILAGADSAGRYLNNNGQPVPFLDAYESLRLAAARSGRRLCGNRVWVHNGAVQVQRGAGTEQLGPTIGSTLGVVKPMHGGRRLLVAYNPAQDLVYNGGAWDLQSSSSGADTIGGATWLGTVSAVSHDQTVWAYSVEMGGGEFTLNDMSWNEVATYTVPPQASDPLCAMQTAQAECIYTIDPPLWNAPVNDSRLHAMIGMAPLGDSVYWTLPEYGTRYVSVGAWQPCNSLTTVQCRFIEIERSVTNTTLMRYSTGDWVGTAVGSPLAGQIFGIGVSEDGRDLMTVHGQFAIRWLWYGSQPITSSVAEIVSGCTVTFRRRERSGAIQTTSVPTSSCDYQSQKASIAPSPGMKGVEPVQRERRLPNGGRRAQR